MFSDNYIVSDKYDLNTEILMSTSSKMPLMYTYLYDKSYLPVLDDNVVYKLNSYFNFRHLSSPEPLHNSRKIFAIESSGDEILGFESKNRIKYQTVSHNITRWNHFIHSVECPEMNTCKQMIDRLTDETDIMLTKIEGIRYSPDASFLGVSLVDDSYNLAEYTDNEYLNKVNNLCKENPRSMRGIITLYQNTTSLSYKLIFNYIKTYFEDDKKLIRRVDNTSGMRNAYIDHLVNREVLTQEQSEFIKSICVGRTTFNLEFIIRDDGTLEKVFLHHFKIKEFENLTTA